jgi:signal transduction histidine kinase
MGSGQPIRARAKRGLAGHAGLLDVVAAVALTIGAISAVAALPADRSVALSALSATACTAVVAVRRRVPNLAAMASLTAVAVYQLASQDQQGIFVVLGVVLTCYSVGATALRDNHIRRAAGIAGYALGAVAVSDAGPTLSLGGVLATWVPVAVIPMALGAFVARGADRVEQLRAVHDGLRDEDEVLARRLVAEERSRVARDLHDVVAHCVSVMVIQAGVARLTAADDPATSHESLDAVVSAGREALIDLRRVVGVLRRTDSVDGDVQPDTARLDCLAGQLRRAGHPVEMRIEGDPNLLAPEPGTAALWIAQEAVTNALRHAPGSTVRIELAVTAVDVRLRVENDCDRVTTVSTVGSGHGLMGMRERALACGGSLRAEPTGSGGFAVDATLPLLPYAGALGRPAELGAGHRLWKRMRAVVSPTMGDGIFAAVWLVALEMDAVTSGHRSGPLVFDALVVAVMALAGFVRRRAALLFLGVVAGGAILLSTGLASPQRTSLLGIYAALVAPYTVAAYLPARRAVAAFGLVAAAIAAAVAVDRASAAVAFGGALMAGLAWTAGRIVRHQRSVTAQLEDATRRLVAERENQALIAVLDERARIARELHARVAQLVTSMVVQAQAASRSGRVDQAVGIVEGVERTGREALSQLRSMLGVLRAAYPESSDPTYAPLPARGVQPLERLPT